MENSQAFVIAASILAAPHCTQGEAKFGAWFLIALMFVDAINRSEIAVAFVRGLFQ